MNRIRRNTSRTYDYPSLAELEKSAISYPDRLAAFSESLKAAGGKAVVLDSPDDVGAAIAREYPSGGSLVSAVELPSSVPGFTLSSPSDYAGAADLDGTDVAVVRGCFGVAENGAVWIDSYGRHRALLFIAEALVVLLDKDSIVDNMHQAYARPELSREREFGTFISGPSKTADIEQALVFGAHGARSLTVLFV